ncbi:hypothetical protein JNO12_21050 [Erwinia aphidicola]|nr:hypothetical protein [Erwinia aphidicola]
MRLHNIAHRQAAPNKGAHQRGFIFFRQAVSPDKFNPRDVVAAAAETYFIPGIIIYPFVNA